MSYESSPYPLPDSLVDRVYGFEEREFTRKLEEPWWRVRSHGPLEDRVTGTRWSYSPDHEVLVHARFSPAAGRPEALGLHFIWRAGQDVLRRLSSLGVPLPASDPTYTVGRSTRGTRTVAYLPGPPPLSDLIYETRLVGHHLHVVVWTERPPGPAYRRRVERHRAQYPWRGTMAFRDALCLGARRGTHLRPGDRRARELA